MDIMDSFTGSYSEYLSAIALQNRVPFSGTFELLPQCNMRCKMCYIVHEGTVSDQDGLKDVDFWSKIIDNAIEQGMLYAVVTGGEPFLYPGIYELLESIKKKPIYLALNTNATLLNRQKVEWLAKYSPGRLNISLYGGSNETYGRLCNNPKGFDQVTNAFSLLNEYHIPYRVHTTLTPDNYCDFDKIIDVCNHFQAPLQMVYYMFPPYRKDKGLIKNDGRFTPKEAAEAAFRIQRNKHKDLQEWWMFLQGICQCFDHPENYSLHGSNKIGCKGGASGFWVDWRGRVSGCGIYNGEHIDLAEVAFADAWKSIVANTEAITLSEKCSFCRYKSICPTCAAAAFCETGYVDGTPEYLCEFSEIYANMLREELKRVESYA